MSEQTIYLTYDLGIGGDYNALFTWLDKHGAKECGESTALIKFQLPEKLSPEDAVKNEMEKEVALRPGDRVYLLYRDKATHALTGKFIFGKRKAATWAGYALAEADSNVDVETE
jgi:hypothetical protein